jgi:hypothetical protein
MRLAGEVDAREQMTKTPWMSSGTLRVAQIFGMRTVLIIRLPLTR